MQSDNSTPPDEPLDTESLVAAVQAGDAGAKEQLVLEVLPDLRAFVRLQAGEHIRRRESVSDLVQSVCREVLEAISEFEWRGEAPFRAWLFQRAERKIVDRARYWNAAKRSGEAGSGIDIDGEVSLRETYRAFARPSEEATIQDEIRRVESAFELLTPQHREIILLARVVGLSHAEIGERMDRSEGAARVLLHRALAELSEVLA